MPTQGSTAPPRAKRKKIKLPYSGTTKLFESTTRGPRMTIKSPPYALPPFPPPHRLNIHRCIKNLTNPSGDMWKVFKIVVVSYINHNYVSILSQSFNVFAFTFCLQAASVNLLFLATLITTNTWGSCSLI